LPKVLKVTANDEEKLLELDQESSVYTLQLELRPKTNRVAFAADQEFEFRTPS